MRELPTESKEKIKEFMQGVKTFDQAKIKMKLPVWKTAFEKMKVGGKLFLKILGALFLLAAIFTAINPQKHGNQNYYNPIFEMSGLNTSAPSDPSDPSPGGEEVLYDIFPITKESISEPGINPFIEQTKTD